MAMYMIIGLLGDDSEYVVEADILLSILLTAKVSHFNLPNNKREKMNTNTDVLENRRDVPRHWLDV